MNGGFFLIAIGIIFLALGIVSQTKRSKKLKSGDFKEVMGKIVDFKVEETQDTDSDGVTSYSTSYYPIIEYEVDGNNYSYTSTFGTSFKRGLGKEQKLLYNVNNPEDVISPKDKTSILLIALGILIIIGGIVFLVRG